MRTLVDRLNISCDWEASNTPNSVSFDRRKDINFHETINHYVAHHDVGIEYLNIPVKEVNACAEKLKKFTRACNGDAGNIINFWIGE